MSPDELAQWGFHKEPGWAGVFTRAQAPAAIPNGTRIIKVVSQRGDAHAIGSVGVVLGSMATPDEIRRDYPQVPFFYFVEWDDQPRVAVGVMSVKITPL